LSCPYRFNRGCCNISLSYLVNFLSHGLHLFSLAMDEKNVLRLAEVNELHNCCNFWHSRISVPAFVRLKAASVSVKSQFVKEINYEINSNKSSFDSFRSRKQSLLLECPNSSMSHVLQLTRVLLQVGNAANLASFVCDTNMLRKVL